MDSNTQIDLNEIINEIKERVLNEIELESAPDPLPKFRSRQLDFNFSADRTAGELRDCEELRFLNFNHARTVGDNPDYLKSHRKGLLKRLVLMWKRRLRSWVHDILGEYFSNEVEYKANLVRFLNRSATYIDARDSSQFWELIQKIDYDLNSLSHRVEILNEEQRANLVSKEKRLISEIYNNLHYLKESSEKSFTELKTLDSVVKGLEAILVDLKPLKETKPTYEHQQLSRIAYDPSYLLLENRFRASEAELKERQLHYANLFKDAVGEVLDIGCGRGELLDIFRDENIPSRGIDIDAAMIERCRQKNLTATLAGASEYLSTLPDESLGGIIAIQVVEHLLPDELTNLIELAYSKLKSRGILVFETINPCSLHALSSNYFRDPTHIAPLHPDTLRHLLEIKGFSFSSFLWLSPVPSKAQLPKVQDSELMGPQYRQTINTLNQTIERLNQIIYGYQDYATVAMRR
jgi:2-polyprenyl-3-methyl-5-hydroxy-6-metoxy-1,4-benzoquinol methylase